MPTDTTDLRSGAAHLRAGRVAEAEALFRAALAAAPDDAEALDMLAGLCVGSGRLEEALGLLRRALGGKGARADLHNKLGAVLARLHREPEAVGAFEEAVRLRPQYGAALANLSTARLQTGRIEAAAAAGRKAVAARPDYAPGYTALSAALRHQGRIAEAIAVQKKGTAIGLDYPEAHNELAAAFEQQGRLAEAIASYRRAVELAPGDAALHSNLLFALNYDPALGPEARRAEHAEWARRHAEPLGKEIAPHANDRTADRRLRVGYVSADFREHTRALFMEPVLSAHDRAGFEVYCYSDVRKPDETTARIRAAADAWRETADLTDAELAERVRADRIDILVELTGHMGNNRLLVFARKPAPVQVAYPGYPNTTGLRAIDYLITDADRDPPGSAGGADSFVGSALRTVPGGVGDSVRGAGPTGAADNSVGSALRTVSGGAGELVRSADPTQVAPLSGADKLYTERLVRLPISSQCYRPTADSPEVGPLPALLRGHVTFCCFNKLVKVSPGMIQAWGAILAAVLGSRLLVMAAGAGREDEDVRRAFVSRGVPAERLDLVRPLGRTDYLWRYNQADITLDTFPYNGHTTTLDGLWMGVPAVTLAGATHVAREGAAVLSLLGLSELVARSPRAYAEAAVRLASDLPRLHALRMGLRQRMAASPLTDAKRLTRELESAYRRMWAAWCARGDCEKSETRSTKSEINSKDVGMK